MNGLLLLCWKWLLVASASSMASRVITAELGGGIAAAPPRLISSVCPAGVLSDLSLAGVLFAVMPADETPGSRA